MSWVALIWSMNASACLTLAAMHLIVWGKQRTAWPNLLFALMAMATAGMAACEWWMMRAETTGEFGLALRWINVPTLVLVVSLVGFVRLYLRAGRLWLAWAVCGLRTLSLILNFVFTPNINYRQITALGHIQFLGESVSVAEGVLNPWMLIGQASLLLLLIFVVDAAFSAWRRGDRRRALLLGVPLGFLMVAGTGQLVLVVWHIVQMPITVSLFFLGIVAAMAYEMSCETLRAVQLSDDLRDSEERFRHAAETVGEFLWEVDRAGRFTYASRSVERILGYTPEELVGKKHFYDLFLPSDREELKAAVFQMFADRQTFRGFANSNVSKSGQIVFLETSCTPVLDPAGKLVGYCGADLDVTDRKRTEQALDQQRNELTRLSRHAAASELSGALAHELNTPLAIILSNAQAAQRLLAQAPPDVAEARAILTDIVCADQRAGEVIRGMRSLIERGQICLQPLNVNEVVEEALQLARSELSEHGITVHHTLAGSVPQVLGDRIQLQQVLLNLISNACEAMAGNPPADRRLTLATATHEGAVRVSVSDTGGGLPPEDAERVFEPFYTTKKEGLGLGLAICRSIVAAHNGRLWAKTPAATGDPSAATTASGGTTFHLELPAVGEVNHLLSEHWQI